MADLPDISPDFSQPLPQVDPNSDLVPYRMSRTDPSQGEVVTTGYGPRARPIQPPSGGGVGVPDMTGLLGEAMQHLPVDEALKATQAAAQYIAQRGYQRDIANGESAPKALLKWLPVMRNSTGLSEALQFQEAQMKARQPSVRAVGGRLYRVSPTGQAEAISPEPTPKVVPPKLHFNNATGEVVQENPDGTLKTVREGTPKPTKPPAPTEEEKDANFEWREAVREQNKTIDSVAGNPATKTAKQKLADAQRRVDDTRKKLDALRSSAISPQEFVPDTSKSAPAPTAITGGLQTGPAGVMPNQSLAQRAAQNAAVPPLDRSLISSSDPHISQRTTPPPAPPRSQRRIGTTYKTPKGFYTWTENGWVKADNAK